VPTSIDTFKKLSAFEQQALFASYLDTAKELLDDAVGSAEIESHDEAEACLDDFEACMDQAAVLKDIIVNAIKAKK
jgi:hypothetical protein